MTDHIVAYDVNAINTFINMVFHAPKVEGEEVFTQASPTAPRGYGLTQSQLTERLSETKVPMPCYFGTSTVTPNAGHMRFKRESFVSFRVFVADDIGTKIPREKVEHLDPTYKLESSKGNEQWGFVLDEPITDYEEAKLLLEYLGKSGVTDLGGLMPAKKVRLPAGVNGKVVDGKINQHPVTLLVDDGPYWTPQSLLDAVGLDVDWEAARKLAHDQRDRTRRYGAAAWQKVHNFNKDGLFDPVLEWLYENDMVVDDSGTDGWIEVQCPWMDEHTSGDSTAGYSPIGQGSMPDLRGFKCFHGHCAGRGAGVFLERIVEWGGPVAPVKEPFPEIVSNFVFDPLNDCAWNIRDATGLRGIKTAVLQKMTPDAFIVRDGVAPKKVNPVGMWVKSPNKVVVAGPTYDPSSNAPLVYDADGALYVNTFKLPEYPAIKIDMKQVRPFLDFMKYLIPEEDELQYFLDWLACKARNPAFRGCGMIMIAKAEGTGRNTLMQIIGKMFGNHNTYGATMDEIMSSQWTEWRANLFVHVDESMAMDNPAMRFKTYDRLKEVVDPMATIATVNVKMGAKMRVKLATSMLFFSNHEDALHVSERTRRFFAVKNPAIPAPQAMFTKLRKWMGSFDKKTDWEVHVWNWLLARPVDVEMMTGPPPNSAALDDMIDAGLSDYDVFAEAALECWSTDLINMGVFRATAKYLEDSGKLPKDAFRAISRIILGKTHPTTKATGNSAGYRIRYGDKIAPIRSKNVHIAENKSALTLQHAATKDELEDFTPAKFYRRMKEWADENGRDFV